MTRKTAIVFIHGLFSSSATWKNFDSIINADPELGDVVVMHFEYQSPKFNLNPLRRIPDFNTLADNLRTYLDVEVADYDDVILVSHSQGGLLIQRYLARMLESGQGHRLERIKLVVMFACPNNGSELFLLARKKVRFWRHPQERELRPINEAVVHAQQVVINRIVHANSVAADKCPIPIRVYAGDSDNIVVLASAKSVFPDAGVVPGDHFSIVKPDSANHRSFTTLKFNLLAARDIENSDSKELAVDSATTGSTTPSPPVKVRLKPEHDMATNRFRLGALNRGDYGRFRAEVTQAHNQDGNLVGPQSWPVPWLDDGTVTSKDIPTFGKPLLDFAHFDFLGLREDLEGTKWLRGNHWAFPSLPHSVRTQYSAVTSWSELNTQYFVLTVRVVRDAPPGYIDMQFQLGNDGTEPYCREISDQALLGSSSTSDFQRVRSLAWEGSVMRARLPSPKQRGFGALPDDLTTRFSAWKSDVADALQLWPDYLAQFNGQPPLRLSLFDVDRTSNEIEYRTQVLEEIVRVLAEEATGR